MKHIVSLGAGVQSSCMALMFAEGELTPMPDCAIFADTGAEPQYVYDWLDWLETKLPYPVHRVENGNLHDMVLSAVTKGDDRSRFASAPFFVDAPEGKGMLRRQCTREFKITPVTRKIRDLCGLAKGERAPRNTTLAVLYMGISLDEALRQKPAREKYIEHRWPLVEARMTRGHCLEWMSNRNYPEPGKSACTFCPYRDDKGWLDMKQNHPQAWADAVKIDEHIRQGSTGMKEQNRLYVHSSLKPLKELDLKQLANESQIDMFGEECEGMCGV